MYEDDEDYADEPEDLEACTDCDRPADGDTCQCCGLPLCSMCHELGSGFAKGHPTAEWIAEQEAKDEHKENINES